MSLFHKSGVSHWELAIIKEDINSILSGKRIHFIHIRNPFADKFSFADPFILEVTTDFIYVLAEAIPILSRKGVIARLIIKRESMTITNMSIILEEPWHLSFPNVKHLEGRTYVLPESAHGKQLFLYELVTEGECKLIKIKTICNDIIWDSDITDFFGDKFLFTARENDYHLDIYKLNPEQDCFEYFQSIPSNRRNMRLAGALFKNHDKVIFPSQISTPYVYGKAVELREIHYKGGRWQLTHIRTIHPPRRLLTRGLHTFNTYGDLTIVDINVYNGLASLIFSELVEVRKRIKYFCRKGYEK